MMLRQGRRNSLLSLVAPLVSVLAGTACVAAAITAFPGALQHLADVPLISWLLAGTGLFLLWPRDS